MKIRRMFAIALVICMVVSCSFAEEKKGNMWDSIGGWFDQAWKDTSGWVSQAWTDATSWVNGAWGDASKWIGQAWNDSSAWVSDIWGDASTWVIDTSDAIGVWWRDTFNTVTETKNNAWEWIEKSQKDLQTQLKQYKDIIAITQNDVSDAENDVINAYKDLLKKINLNEKDSEKVIDTIKAYAGEKGIAVSSLEKILLPYLTQLAVDSGSAGNGKIPAVAVAQYLTGIIEKIGLENEKQAQQLISELEMALKNE